MIKLNLFNLKARLLDQICFNSTLIPPGTDLGGHRYNCHFQVYVLFSHYDFEVKMEVRFKFSRLICPLEPIFEVISEIFWLLPCPPPQKKIAAVQSISRASHSIVNSCTFWAPGQPKASVPNFTLSPNFYSTVCNKSFSLVLWVNNFCCREARNIHFLARGLRGGGVRPKF